LVRVQAQCARADLLVTHRHNRGQGLVERALGGILTTLKTVTFPRPATWAHAGRLEALQASINETPHGSLGMSPFAALHGFEPRMSTSSSLGLEEPLFESISQYHEVILAAQERALLASALGQLVNKSQHDDHHRAAPEFKTGEYVFALEETLSNKLLPKAKGPYRVAGREPGDVYVLHRLLAPGERRRVHVSRLQAFDMHLTSEAAEATRRLGGGEDDATYGIVAAIDAHVQRVDGGYDFSVRWAGSDETTLQSGQSLARVDLFREYLQRVGLSLKVATKPPASLSQDR
jgi:hypothetical protein